MRYNHCIGTGTLAVKRGIDPRYFGTTGMLRGCQYLPNPHERVCAWGGQAEDFLVLVLISVLGSQGSRSGLLRSPRSSSAGSCIMETCSNQTGKTYSPLAMAVLPNCQSRALLRQLVQCSVCLRLGSCSRRNDLWLEPDIRVRHIP